MDSVLKVEKIIREAERLDFDDKINVISGIFKLLKKDNHPNRIFSITQLRGMGKKIWYETDGNRKVKSAH
jgi:hypothetical protein